MEKLQRERSTELARTTTELTRTNYNNLMGANEFVVRPEDGKQLRAAVAEGDRFRHQGLIDWYRDHFVSNPDPSFGVGSHVSSINGEGEET